ncbi:MAG: hypothetical protein D6737_19055 [Chloroflexi bacterium]|nr:MAG: hypothetical protein CUN54_06530 [Phototrophicales bacterium]RMF76981.1 MAG: hypothetical protein D6737_19055 [Chloroflexota bacterium]
MITTAIIVGIAGIFVGGVLNALADELPTYTKPKLPHYPDGTPRPLIAWLGISAFLTGHRTAETGSSLSWRYPLTELATSIAMIVTVISTENDPEVTDEQLVFWLVYMAVFVLITVIDMEHRLILFSVIIPSLVLALLDAVLTPHNHEPDLESALIGAGLGFGIFFIMYLGGILYTYVRGLNVVAFGYGDVMLITLSGLILGWELLIFAMFITVFIGAIGSVVYIVVNGVIGRGNMMMKALPYGPYIVLGTVIMLLFSAEVRQIVAGY